ncbi:hypothetical protein [Thalassotalea agariperforans]
MRKLRLLFIKTWLLTALLLCFSVQAINAVTPCAMQHFSSPQTTVDFDVMPCHQMQTDTMPMANDSENNTQCDNCQCCHVLFSHNPLFTLEINSHLREQNINSFVKPLLLPAALSSLYRPPISLYTS